MDYSYLKELEGSLKEIIQSPKVKDKEFYQVLKDLVDLKLNIEEFSHRFEEFSDVMTSMAQGDFNKRIEIPIDRNLFAFIGTSVNSVIDELEKSVVKKSFLETLLETHPLPTIITDERGVILFANKEAHSLTNYPAKSLLRLIIKNLFDQKLQFGNFNTMETIEQEKTVLSLYNANNTEVHLSVQKIYDKHGTINGYIYLFEEI